MTKPFKPSWFDYFISTCFFLLMAMFSYPVYNDDVTKLIWILPVCMIICYLIFRRLTRKVRERNRLVRDQFPDEWIKILEENVNFYRQLSDKDRKTFEVKINVFLAEKVITGIDTEVTDEDKILVASSAIIPIFAFSNWHYDSLQEVLLYPNSFNRQYETSGDDNRNISGMVGNGILNGKMILSKKDLHFGFEHPQNKKNVGIHEFVHLIDESDGAIDGIPDVLIEHKYARPWLEAIHGEIKKIQQRKSDINPYGGTSDEEFFPVASEYFFQRPELFKKKHPQLYKMMNKVFQQDPVSQLKNKVYHFKKRSK